jgi:hypothetical protein
VAMIIFTCSDKNMAEAMSSSTTYVAGCQRMSEQVGHVRPIVWP